MNDPQTTAPPRPTAGTATTIADDSSAAVTARTQSPTPDPSGRSRGIDPRGPRFGAAITAAVLALALIAGPGPIAAILLSIQVLAFAAGALIGLQAQPYGVIYRSLVRPRLGAPAELEDPAPPRFAQAVGLAFAVVGLIGLISGVDAVFYVATGMALAAAFLNAAFNFCLGCEMYLLGQRLIRH